MHIHVRGDRLKSDNRSRAYGLAILMVDGTCEIDMEYDVKGYDEYARTISCHYEFCAV